MKKKKTKKKKETINIEEFLKTVRCRLFTETEVHIWTGIPLATLRTLRSRPNQDPIPYMKLGRLVRYREDLVLKWMERNTLNCDNVRFEAKSA